MSRDLAVELIELRRALPEHVALAALTGSDPAAGIEVPIPEDPRWRLALEPDPEGWRLVEVQQLPEPLGDQREVLGLFGAQQAAAQLQRHFQRLQLQCRNAACGTPSPQPRDALRLDPGRPAARMEAAR